MQELFSIKAFFCSVDPIDIHCMNHFVETFFKISSFVFTEDKFGTTQG